MIKSLVSHIEHNHKRLQKDILFRLLIIDKNNSDHVFLRQSINAVVPQVIIESIYEPEEAFKFFNSCKSAPHFIFLNKEMLKVWGRNMVDLIKTSAILSTVPIIFLTNTFSESQKLELLQQGADNLYSMPYQPDDLLKIVGDVNGQWLA